MADDAGWQPLDAARLMWGCFEEGGYSPEPMAIFADEDDARHWAAHPSRSGSVVVMEVRDLDGQAWNSIHPYPAVPQ